MATFTATLSELLGVNRPEDADHSVIGLDDYPIWNADYRWTLNNKIVMRFWNREIGFETVEMFKHHMRRVMGEEMPYYNQLALSTQYEFDPFETINVQNLNTLTGKLVNDGTTTDTGNTTSDAADSSTSATTSDTTEDGTTTSTSEGTEQGSSTSNTTGTDQGSSTSTTDVTESSSSDTESDSDSTSRSVSSDTPQTRLAGYEDYATASTDGVSNSQSTSASSSTGESTTEQTGSTDSTSTSETEGTTDNTTTSSTDGTTTANTHSDSQTDTSGTTHSVQDSTAEGTSHSTADTTQTTRDYNQGTQGVKSELLLAYRATLINVDKQILDSLEKLFMGVWDVTDSHTQNENYFGVFGYYYW